MCSNASALQILFLYEDHYAPTGKSLGSATAICVASAANTLDSSGNALLSTCKVAVNVDPFKRSTQEQNDAAICNGWVWGFLEGNMVTEVNAGLHVICVPEEVTLEQAERVFVRYLEDHSAELHKSAAGLAYSSV